jgi:DNA-binding CsgD family transcriptional regulator/PAS domain-containing protein
MTWDLDTIERAFADAATQPALWGKAMDVIATETGSVGTILFPLRGATLPSTPSSEAIQRSLEAYFIDGWHARDERFKVFDVLVRDGAADDFAFTNLEQMKKHPYFQEFLRPHNLQFFAGVKMAAGEDLWCVSIQRSVQQGPFSSNEMRKLAALSQKFASAAALARAIGVIAADAAVEAIELSTSAIVLLNRSGEILRVNRATESLLGSELRVLKRRLVSHDQNATMALDRALHALLWAKTNAALMPPVVLPRRAKRPILAHPIKLATVSASVFADCQAILVLVDLEQRPRPPQEALRTSFELTPAEARIAVRVGAGEDLVAIADELGIAKETARRQLASVFQKTGVNRQAELVSLLASLLYSRT